MAKQIIRMPFPIQGLNRRFGYQDQPTLTTPDAVNVRPDDVKSERTRGGSRPGLVRQYTESDIIGAESNGSEPVRMLGSVRAVQSGIADFQFWEETFASHIDTLGGVWDVPLNDDQGFNIEGEGGASNWATNGVPVYPGPELAAVDCGAVREELAGFDPTEPYRVAIKISPTTLGNGEFGVVGQFSLYIRMENVPAPGVPNLAVWGVHIGLIKSAGVYSGFILVNVDGTIFDTQGLIGGTENTEIGGWFEATIDVNDVTSVLWHGESMLATPYTMPVAIGSRFGFGLEEFPPNEPLNGGPGRIDTFRIVYGLTALEQGQAAINRTYLVGSAGNRIRLEENDQTMSIISDQDADVTDVTINPDYQVSAVERGGKLYIADHSGDMIVAQGDAVFNDAAAPADNTIMVDDDADFVAAGVNPADHSVVITNCLSTGMTNNTYFIDEVAPGGNVTYLQLTAAMGGSGNNRQCQYTIQRHPKVLDPLEETVELWVATPEVINDPGTGILTNLNQVPVGNPLIAVYRDRIVLAGGKLNQQIWYMSAQGFPDLWDFSDTAELGIGAAVAGTVAPAGVIGEPLTALIPHSDDYLIFGTYNSIWTLRGEATLGGIIDNLSHSIGVIHRGAWCHGPSGETIFLSRNGLYAIAPGAAQFPLSLSAELMPRELNNIDGSIYDLSMAYDVEARGIHIYATERVRSTTESNPGIHFWFDWELKSFWPVTLWHFHEPTAIIEYDAIPISRSGVIMGTSSSRLFKYDNGAASDDGVLYETRIMLGPVVVSSDSYKEAVINELIAATAENSGPVDWSLYVGDTADEVVGRYQSGDTPVSTGRWGRGYQKKFRKVGRGFAFGIVLDNPSAVPWAIERIHAVLTETGAQKKTQ